MTLDEAIKHCEEVAKEEIVKGNLLGNHSGSFYTGNKDKCERCASEHRQIADWLKELKQYRELFDSSEEASFVHTTFYEGGLNGEICD